MVINILRVHNFVDLQNHKNFFHINVFFKEKSLNLKILAFKNFRIYGMFHWYDPKAFILYRFYCRCRSNDVTKVLYNSTVECQLLTFTLSWAMEFTH